MIYKILKILAIILLLWSLDKHSMTYYHVLCIFVFGISLYSTFYYTERNKILIAWIFGFILVIFNPIIPLPIHKELWIFIDLVTALFMSITMFIPSYRDL